LTIIDTPAYALQLTLFRRGGGTSSKLSSLTFCRLCLLYHLSFLLSIFTQFCFFSRSYCYTVWSGWT